MAKRLFFRQVTIRNFMSYGNATTTIELDRPGTTLIQGRNLDNVEQGIGGNGTGKTTIINAICYACYGTPLSTDIKIDDVVNDVNNKNCVVSVTVDIDDDTYVITRYRKYKDGPESNYVTIFKNGDDTNLAKATTPETDKFMPTLIGIPKELFVKLVVYDADDRSFFRLEASKQRDLLENLFQITILSEKADALKRDLKQHKIDLDLLVSKSEQQQVHIDNHEKLIVQAQQRVETFDLKKEQDTKALTEQLSELEQIDVEGEVSKFDTIAGIQSRVEQHNADIANIKHEQQLLQSQIATIKQQRDGALQQIKHDFENDKTSLNQKLDSYNQTTELLQGKVREVKQQITRITDSLDSKKKEQKQQSKEQDRISASILSKQARLGQLEQHQCPECGQSVVGDDHATHVQQYTTQIEELQREQDQVRERLSQLVDEVTSLEDSMEQFTTVDLLEAQRELDRHQHDSSIDEIQREIETINSKCRVKCEEVEAEFEQQIQGVKDNIRSLQESIDKITTTIKSIELTKPVPIFSKREQLDKVERTIERLSEQLNAVKTQINPHQEALDELALARPCGVDFTPINEKKKLIDHTSYLIKSLTDKKSFIRKRLISKRLPYLNERLKYYLQNMGLPYQVEFQSDLSPSITKRGKSKGFGNLSHGQKARVNFALSFAFRDVLEQMHCKINLCLLDEVLDKALCEVGAMAAVQLITEKARMDNISMFVITHKKELATRFQHHLIVTLENGFTSVEQ